MTLQDYRRHYADLNDKISQAQAELDDELVTTKDEFNKLYQRQQVIDKCWFVTHLDFFLKYKKRFQSDYGLGHIIIDFLALYRYAGLVGGAAFSSKSGCKIFLKDLLSLWDNGFTYQGNPIIGYEWYIHEGKKIIITYVKNCRIEVASTNYLRTKNPLELPEEIIKKVQQANICNKYPDWHTYKTIDVVRRVLNKKEIGDEMV